MNKRAIIKKIIARLTDELEIYFRAAIAEFHISAKKSFQFPRGPLLFVQDVFDT